MTIAYTRPKVKTDGACPPFKTPRLLGARALIADAVNKANGKIQTATYPSINPGFGIKAHQDGYNVLYGDYAAKWHGDPQRQIIYWNTELTFGYKSQGIWNTRHYAGGQGGLCTADARRYGLPLIWHLLDEQHNMDVGVPADD
jgi:hypothetical protein